MSLRHNPATYRERADELRKLAETARDQPTIDHLLAMAGEFEDEASQLEEALASDASDTLPTDASPEQ